MEHIQTKAAVEVVEEEEEEEEEEKEEEEGSLLQRAELLSRVEKALEETRWGRRRCVCVALEHILCVLQSWKRRRRRRRRRRNMQQSTQTELMERRRGFTLDFEAKAEEEAEEGGNRGFRVYGLEQRSVRQIYIH
jgi:hypothetical protein